MTVEKLRVAVVGAGRWGGNLARAFSSVPSCHVVAICDNDEERLRPFAALHPRARLCSSVAAVLRDSDLDAVVIATPSRTHFELVLLALSAGKHVFVEKPIALSTSECVAIRSAAQRASRKVMVGHLLRYHPAVIALHRLIDSGCIGKLEHVVTHRSGTRASTDLSPWWELGPHDVSVSRHLFGIEPKRIAATCEKLVQGERITARLGFGAGRSAVITVTSAPELRLRSVTAIGTTGIAKFLDGAEPRLVLCPFPERHAANAGERLAVGAWEMEGTDVPFSGEEPLYREAAHFAAAILHGSPIATDEHEGLRVVTILEAGERAFQRDFVPLDGPDDAGLDVRADFR